MVGFLDQLGPGIGTLLLIMSTLDRIFPDQLMFNINKFFQKILNIFNPYVEITFEEFPSGSYTRSKVYSAVETYLGTNFYLQAERLNASIAKGSRCVALSMDDYEGVNDVYEGIKVSWMRSKSLPKSNVISLNAREEERRSYVLAFRKGHREVITGPYLSHVLSEGKSIAKRNRRQKLYTNVSRDDDWGDEKKTMWRSVVFEHPSTFDTLAMDAKKKRDIMDDLIAFTKGKEYYKQIGKAWKRGYLLYGPPGTGKSTMIAAMANFLHYDVYDLELTSVKDNTELRKLMMEISKRAILVIEDIDCSLDITGKRKKNKGDENDLKEIIARKVRKDNENGYNDENSKVTLSGLLNFIDGLWSACGGERIIVFTTNYIEKLDGALIRRGRMDKHIEMSYCCFETFKVLAKNYLKVESHKAFEQIRLLFQEIDISPADVAENLMEKSAENSVDECMENLIKALHKAKSKKEKEIAEKRSSKGLMRIRSVFSRMNRIIDNKNVD
ncbi:hypothetical protein BUALT_Bualt14G0015300 [Buddleja alternifolia]|uniref:AAA+ ATPase domain-containing protein n=1 Tax=Buddleja alternifolia TaxID=168488 RepID=A0AAV6WGY2_9LAMI|nr:hypothetical protein BUALT_Bualt14G0015300 [Buddleja alternifolia]